MSSAYILVVDDEPDIRSLVSEILEDEGYKVAVAEDGASARKSLRDRLPDLILLDIWMPDVDGISLLREWSESDQGLPCPVIMMSGHGTVETAVEATRLGAYDFLEKPITLAKLLLTTERGLEAARLVNENVGLKRRSDMTPEPAGHSAAMQRLREQVKRVAQHDSWVLISGEPGSGRETVSRYLHAHSARSDRPFIDVSVSTIAKENAARELFGSEENGQISYGRLEQASGGTLFLDEVADMDMAAQAQLVGALDNRTFLRIGGTEPVQVDARIIAATQKDLAHEVAEGNFREDLFYQLNVVPLNVPPLRERREDVPDLLAQAADMLVERDKLPYRRFSMAAQNFLRNHNWPGNVRELINLVERLLILGHDDEISLAEAESAVGVVQAQQVAEGGSIPGLSFDMPLREARESFEKLYLEYQFELHDGNISKMASAVGVERTHLYRKLRDRGIEIKDRR